MNIDKVRYQKSPIQPAYELKESFPWGVFVRYLEFGDDGFPNRQVDEYENGYLVRYDRVHWEDQFGCLTDFKDGEAWVRNWGHSNVISRKTFELKWNQAADSPPFVLRQSSPDSPPPWITHYYSGQWNGQT